MTTSNILQVTSLGRSYPTPHGELSVLRDVTFSLPAGESCAIVGPSGSGKTTLLGLAAGLDRPSAGSVRIANREISSLDEDQRAKIRNDDVGFVFQNFQLLPTLTALENVMVPMELRGRKGVKSLAMDLLGRVGLGNRVDHYPSQLSGGEQQRVALARAFINNPKILFADEPTGNLDEETSHRVTDMLFKMNHDAGTALVLVTHNLELARKTRRIINLKGGQVVADEPVPHPAAT